MLTAIQVGNFKAFAETQRIPLRPLTLIYGANSSGKSSILHSLVLARNAQETGDFDAHRTSVGGESVDLGGFRQYVHRRDLDKSVEWSAELNTKSFSGNVGEMLAPVSKITLSLGIGLPQIEEMAEREGIDTRTGQKILMKVPTGNLIPAGTPEITSYSLQGDGQLLIQMSKKRDGNLQLDRLDYDHPVFREVIKAMVLLSTTTETIHPEDFEGLEETISELVPNLIARRTRFLPEGLSESSVFSPSGQQLFFPISKARRSEELSAAVHSFLPRKIDDLLRGVSQIVAGEISSLRYLGPLRSYPPRHLAFSQHHDPNWYAGGGYAWDVIRRDENVRKLVNEWLSANDRLQTPYELRIRHLLTIDDLDNDYTQIIEQIEHRFTEEGPYDWDLFGEIYLVLEKIKKNEANLGDIQELILVDRRSDTIVSHRDVGIGVSQVLPVLVGAYASKNQIIAIEQPEIHLHPALQADLGDVFIQSAIGENKNRFLIETHSEHLLLRIMRRMRETNAGKLPEGCLPVRPEDVMVLFVEPDGSRSIVREMPLNENGELVKAWPGGFFEEGLREIF
ncbi:MAG: AAA family ATPase [Thermodesulfobacteriota bacterium]